MPAGGLSDPRALSQCVRWETAHWRGAGIRTRGDRKDQRGEETGRPGSLGRSGGLPGEETALELRLEGRQRNKDPQKEAGLATVSAAGEARP